MRKFFRVLLLVFVGIGVVLFLIINYLQPTYDGTKQVKGLSEKVNVYYDNDGVPHILAANEKDAMKALGYVHAQDRLWQMELMRRIAPGRLSEILGDKLLEVDQLFIGLEIDELSELLVAKLDSTSNSFKMASAYIEGINEFVKNGPEPIEFLLLDVSKTAFTIKDIYNIVGYMGFSFQGGQHIMPLLTEIRQKLGDEYLSEFMQSTPKEYQTISAYPSELSVVTEEFNRISQKMPVPVLEGSNSWVLGPQKTKEGKVILENDPHIKFAQPTTWYEAHLHAPDFEVYGYYLAGVPFPLLAHNKKYAFGLTMFLNDDLDLFFEQVNPENTNQYKTGDTWSTFETKTKEILIKGGRKHLFTYQKSSKGSIINSFIKVPFTKPISLKWTYLQKPFEIIDALYFMSHANDKEDFEAYLSLITAPGLNITYGDAKGNIAWWAAAKLYTTNFESQRDFIQDGSIKDIDSFTYIDFKRNPHAINPVSGYVFSANNQPDSIPGIGYYPGNYTPDDRAERIVSLLDAKNNWTKEEVAQMALDVTSKNKTDNIAELLPFLEDATLSQDQRKAKQILSDWKGNSDLNEIGPTIYNKWIYFFLKETFESKLGTEMFLEFLKPYYVQRNLDAFLRKDNSIWWGNTPKSEIMKNSFQKAVSELKNDLGDDFDRWQWKYINQLTHKHALSSGGAVLASIFDVGPYAVPGNRQVINNMKTSFIFDKTAEVLTGPSTRRIIDFSDIENSYSILPTGQSGNRFSKFYKNQAKRYAKGVYRKMEMNVELIRNNSPDKLILIP